jgi:hypothetical protein
LAIAIAIDRGGALTADALFRRLLAEAEAGAHARLSEHQRRPSARVGRSGEAPTTEARA